MEIDDGVFVSPLPNDHEDQGRRANQRKRDNKIRLEPVVALPLVENNLQSTQPQGHKSEPNIVDVSFTELAALEIRRVLNQSGRKKYRYNPDGNVDKENPAPGEVVGNP